MESLGAQIYISRNGGGSASTGRAVLTTPHGTYASTKIVSENAAILASVFQTPAGPTISAKSISEHGLTTGQTVSMRVGGWNGLTKRAHPANGNSWTITVVDPLTFILNGSVWVPNSIFLHGVFYTGSLTIDARPSLTSLCMLISQQGGGKIELPAGIIAFLTKEAGNTGLSLPSGLHLKGQGADVTFIYAGDLLNAFVLQAIGTSDIILEDLTIYGNRQYQGVGGFHSIRLGSDASTVVDNVTIRRIALLSNAGYGIGLQSEGAFTNCVIEDIFYNEGDSDFCDVKNRVNGNFNNRASNCKIYNLGLYKIGVDAAGVALPANPFTTVSGQSIVTVAHVNNGLQIGIAVTYSGASTFNGVNPNTTGTILTVATDTYTIDLGQVASGNGTGGGSAVLEYASRFSSGDAGLDLRGERWIVDTVHVEGNMQSLTGVRLRTGTLTGLYSINGKGAWNSTVTGVTGKNNNTSRVGILVYNGGNNNAVQGIAGEHFQYGYLAGPSTIGGSLTGANIFDADFGAYIDGEKIAVGDSVMNGCGTSFFVDGGDQLITGDFGPDPFATVATTNTITATLPGHGLAPAASVVIQLADNFNGVNVNGTRTVVSVPTPDTFTFTVTASATGTGSGGGEKAVFSFGSQPHSATNVSFNNCISNGATVLGYKVDTHAVDASITASQSVGDFAPRADNGLRTVWRSPQFADLVRVVSLPTAGTTNPTTLTTADSGKTFYVPSNATEQALVTLPSAATLGIGSTFTFMSLHATLGIKITCVSGQIRIGTVNASSGGTVSCTSLGCTVTVRMITSSGYVATSSIGTWASP